MPKAGEYPTRFDHLRVTRPTPDTFGQKAEVETSQGYLWGAVEDVSAGTSRRLESEQHVLRATIKLRNYPSVQPGDVLRDVGRNERWHVTSLYRGLNEMLAEVEK